MKLLLRNPYLLLFVRQLPDLVVIQYLIQKIWKKDLQNILIGSFTANFKALPPPIPPEYVATLFTVVATAFIGSWRALEIPTMPTKSDAGRAKSSTSSLIPLTWFASNLLALPAE